MIVMLALLGLCQTKPGPLDAFKANYASVRVNTRFGYTMGVADRDQFNRHGLQHAAAIGVAEIPLEGVSGRWECDGVAEHLDVRPTAEMPPELKNAKGGRVITHYQAPLELLYDGEVAAYHWPGEGDWDLQVVMTSKPSPRLHGPFMFFDDSNLPDRIAKAFPGVTPSYREVSRDGLPLELAIYQRDFPDEGGWARLEIYYDPSIGYLPRRLRFFVDGSDPTGKESCSVREVELVEARPCAAGGFVPTEFYQASYDITFFSNKYPKLDEDIVVRPDEPPVKVGHFRVTEFSDRKGRVRLDKLETVRLVASIGGTVRLGGRRTLSLDEVKSSLGQRLTDPASQALPNIDEDELHRYDRPRRSPWAWYALASAIVIVFGIFAWRRRRAWGVAALIGLGLLAVPGCGRVGPPVTRLTGTFMQPRLVFDPAAPFLPMALTLRNEGNHALRLLEIDGGCSCRRVDATKLPVSIRPGESVTLPVQLHDRRQYVVQDIVFRTATDHGTLAVPVSLFAVPAHSLSPAAIALNDLEEADEGAFELVHRTVYQSAGEKPSVDLSLPDGLKATRVGTKSGHVESLAGYIYEDATYLVVLKDRSLGLHRGVIRLRGPDGRQLIEAPVVWNRSPYLSTVPARVVLGARPVRVFLRCRNESIEMTRVLSAPQGVKAIVSSTRELTVSLADWTPGIIDGTIEVGTSAKDRPPVRVAVIRYAPKKVDTPSAASR